MISRCAYREHFRNVLAYDFKASKFPVLVYTTLNASEPSEMSEEMERAARRSRKVEKPCAHYCFSLAPGEVLSTEQWAEFFAAVVEEFGCLQAVGVTHADTPHVNAHLVMNRVKADGRAWSTSNDRKRLRSLCTKFEKKFGLRILPAKSDKPRVCKDELEKADRLFRQHKAPTPVPARMQLSETVRATLALSRSPEDFSQKLAEHGITVRWRIENDTITGSSYARGDVSISGKNAGITVRAVREQFSRHEHDRLSTPGSPAPCMARHLEGATTRRATDDFAGADGGTARDECPFGRPERAHRKAHRNPTHDGGDATGTPERHDLIDILSEASRYGALGLLGLLDLIIRNSSPGRFHRHPSRRQRQPFISLPL